MVIVAARKEHEEARNEDNIKEKDGTRWVRDGVNRGRVKCSTQTHCATILVREALQSRWPYRIDQVAARLGKRVSCY